MDNIFEGAKFGDTFVCRNNKVGILVCCCETTNTALLMFADNYETYFDYSIKRYRLDGICVSSGIKYDEFDVVSKYQEPIDEDLVEELNDKIEKYESELCELNAWKDSIEKKKVIDEEKLDELSENITNKEIGDYRYYEDSKRWYSFKDGVKAGIKVMDNQMDIVPNPHIVHIGSCIDSHGNHYIKNSPNTSPERFKY